VVLELGWPDWRITTEAEYAHRRALGLPEATDPSMGSLEIQAYDRFCVPELAAQGAELAGRRPFVGALTLESPTDADDEVLSWIAAGTPPIYFGFGSMRVTSPADTVAMIGAACTQLGEQALICSGASDFAEIPHVDPVKVVDTAGLAAVFPACRAVVHHGGAGTTVASLRAGIPTLILGLWVDIRSGQLRSPAWESAPAGSFRKPPRKHWSRIYAPSSLRSASLEPVRSPPG
jgi:UDP:flavonoid glycosyltransferase YjiC (YdhE family)